MVFSQLKNCYGLSRVLVKALWVNFNLRYKILSVRSNLFGVHLVHFPKTLAAVAFLKIN